MRKAHIFLYIFIAVFLVNSCRTQPVNIVRIPVKTKDAIGFVKYKSILYEGITIEKFPSDYDPSASVDYFFLNELPKTIRKEVSRHIPDESDQTVLKEGEILLIGGKLNLNVKERNVIDEDRKKKARVFKKIENWEMEFSIFFRDPASGKNVFSNVFRESMNGVEKNKPDYNFEFLFRKITEKFLRVFMGLGRLESRYLFK